MNYRLFTAADIVSLHDSVLNPGELQGMAGGKSLEGALSRIEFRLQYGLIEDMFDLAAVYAVAVSQAHVFNDGNKRTAHIVMEACLALHSISIEFTTQEVGDIIIEVAQGKMDEAQLATWLRTTKLGQ